MAKTRRARKARKSTRKSVRKNKVYRGGNPLELAYVTNYRIWASDKKNKDKFDNVLLSLNTLIDDMKTNQPSNIQKLEKLESTKQYLDRLAADWPSALQRFKNSNPSVATMQAVMYKP